MTASGSSVAAVGTPSPDARECGTCTLCCKLLAIAALDKPAGTWCRHCAPGRGCRIYEQRPDVCRTFNCMWLLDPRLGPQWKPEKSKFVLQATPGGDGIEVRCDPAFPTAWRAEPFYSQILHWAREAEAMRTMVVVYVGKTGTLVTPDREFALGEVPPEHTIVREVAGNRVVNAYVERPPRADST